MKCALERIQLRAARDALAAALRPFVMAHIRDEDRIGDSDLYDEQPRPAYVTLGDLRRARAALRAHGGD